MCPKRISDNYEKQTSFPNIGNLNQNETNKPSQIALILIIGGALGNILDRAGDGAVTDFLHLYINNFSFFIFNPADAFICIGAVLLITSEFLKPSHG